MWTAVIAVTKFSNNIASGGPAGAVAPLSNEKEQMSVQLHKP